MVILLVAVIVSPVVKAVVVTVQVSSISRHVFSLDSQLDTQTHADILLLETKTHCCLFVLFKLL